MLCFCGSGRGSAAGRVLGRCHRTIGRREPSGDLAAEQLVASRTPAANGAPAATAVPSAGLEPTDDVTALLATAHVEPTTARLESTAGSSHLATTNNVATAVFLSDSTKMATPTSLAATRAPQWQLVPNWLCSQLARRSAWHSAFSNTSLRAVSRHHTSTNWLFPKPPHPGGFISASQPAIELGPILDGGAAADARISLYRGTFNPVIAGCMICRSIPPKAYYNLWW